MTAAASTAYKRIREALRTTAAAYVIVDTDDLIEVMAELDVRRGQSNGHGSL